jgi:hypothetical protein
MRLGQLGQSMFVGLVGSIETEDRALSNRRILSRFEG